MKIVTHLLFALVIIAYVGRVAAAAAGEVTTGSIDLDLGSDPDHEEHEHEHEAAVLRLGSKEEAPVSVTVTGRR